MNLDLVWDDANSRGDWRVTPGGRLSTGNLLVSAVLISLFTDRAEDPPDRRGWWCDSLDGILIGSRLRDLRRAKIANRPQLIATASDILAEALQWMQDTGLVSRIDITVTAPPATPNTPGTLLTFLIKLYQPNAGPTAVTALWSAV